jgi:hypothetical protein
MRCIYARRPAHSADIHRLGLERYWTCPGFVVVLSLPDIPQRELIFAASLGVVIFSIVVQSMTMEALAIRTGYGSVRSDGEPTH